MKTRFSHKEVEKNRNEIASEIVNLSATLNLPKGTEAFISDIHGESDRFSHIMRSGAGNISKKVEELFTGRLTKSNQKKLACLIYYPSEVLKNVQNKLTDKPDLEQWQMDTFNNLIEMLRYMANKYPKKLVKESVQPKFWEIIENLLMIDTSYNSKQLYCQGLLGSIVKLGLADDFIIALCHAIQRMAIERIHILGDIYGRGLHPDRVIAYLSDHWQNFDIQWGNHDILWMGSMAGSKLCMLNLIRICARYHNLKLLNEAYDIDLTSIVKFARHSYRPLPNFEPKVDNVEEIPKEELVTDNCVQQAATIMQFKLEGQAIKRRPEFEMDDRLFLDKLSQSKRTIEIGGVKYNITNGCFQMVNPANPYQISHPEQVVLIDLINQFINSSKLNEHMWFMFDHGSMYLKHNGNLLFHGCVPVDEQGNFIKWEIDSRKYSGRDLFDYFTSVLRDAMRHPTTGDCFNSDVLWYLWSGKDSPLFGKDKMTTFERYFIDDADLQKESLNPFYKLCDKKWFVERIKDEFDLEEDSRIVIGRTPEVKAKSPLSKGKIIFVNGGRPKIQNEGGFTLLYNSFGMQIVKLSPFISLNDAVFSAEIATQRKTIERFDEQKMVTDTDFGDKIKQRIEDLCAELKD
ncbi:fructose-bisphosphatase class III [Companilactobacillus alimentarius]|uniref:Fructose-1,6-bisphosphatase class 3 n=1 Tax=Companilactobacillus alimentarius DSM 20249 TaxID=1423720 RepID=A0A2K9HNW1_9LACO|nr:fructose-bisphosphatase class III [Companilactobacillus alimentarius]AUI71993.1 fructose-1,6-bisphosphatase [Companilactobacillus alimentarius DSM 20249]KRK77942.1 fructose-1,6-bisphosphatase [Companilactobacillus alimentarius DSM 20249]GEO44759.1 fructose-1,6-bisphosphatase class 3 [Companilactobacillus alimentarius]